MKQPLYVTLRALVQGSIAGTLIVIVVGVAVLTLGPEALAAMAFMTGPLLIGLSHLLERRAKRKGQHDA